MPMLISDWSIRVNFSRTSVESMLGNSSAAVMPQSMTSSVLWPRLATNSHHGKNESESVGNRPAESCDSIAYAGVTSTLTQSKEPLQFRSAHIYKSNDHYEQDTDLLSALSSGLPRP